MGNTKKYRNIFRSIIKFRSKVTFDFIIKYFLILNSCFFITNLCLAAELIKVSPNNKYFPTKNTLNILQQLDNAYSFTEEKIVTLPDGNMRYKLIQKYKNIPVWNMNLVTANPVVKLITEQDYITGSYLVKIEDDIQSVIPGITKLQAVNMARSAYGVKKIMQIKNPDVKLVIKNFDNEGAKLVYVVNFLIDNGQTKHPFFMVDAVNGDILDSWEGLTHLDVADANNFLIDYC